MPDKYGHFKGISVPRIPWHESPTSDTTVPPPTGRPAETGCEKLGPELGSDHRSTAPTRASVSLSAEQKERLREQQRKLNAMPRVTDSLQK